MLNEHGTGELQLGHQFKSEYPTAVYHEYLK